MNLCFKPPIWVRILKHNTCTKCKWQLGRTKPTKQNTKVNRGRGSEFPIVWHSTKKAPCTIQKEGERRKHQNTAAKEQKLPCMYVCMWMKILFCYNLLTADFLQCRASRIPSWVCIFLDKVVCILSKEYTNGMLREQILSVKSVSSVTILSTTVPRLYNKLKNKYKRSVGVKAENNCLRSMYEVEVEQHYRPFHHKSGYDERTVWWTNRCYRLSMKSWFQTFIIFTFSRT